MLKVVTEVDLEVVRLNRPNMVRDDAGVYSAIRRYCFVTQTLRTMCSSANINFTDIVHSEFILPQYNFRNLNHYKFLEVLTKLLETQNRRTAYEGIYLETWKYMTIRVLMEEDL